MGYLPAGSQGFCIMCWTGWECIGRKGKNKILGIFKGKTRTLHVDGAFFFNALYWGFFKKHASRQAVMKHHEGFLKQNKIRRYFYIPQIMVLLKY